MLTMRSTKKALASLLNSSITCLHIIVIMVAAVFSAHAAETTTYYHTDLLGSPVASSNETGTLVWNETYKPYGERVINDPQAPDNTLWYTGKPHDSSTGLSYYGARYYDPVIGRFMAIDPVGFQEGNPTSFNRYAYANNNPYKYVDPDGNSAIDLIFLAADIGKLAGAVYSGAGIGAAVVDVGLSLVGVASPIPGVGQTLKGLNVLKSVKKVQGATKSVANPVPGTLARVVPGNVNPTTLGRTSDVFVTDAKALQGLNAKQIADKLTIPQSSSGFKVIEFPTPSSGIASSVFRNNPGFVGGGRTAGGAPEFVIPNGPVPAGATTRIVQ